MATQGRGNVADVPPDGPLCLTGRIRVEVDGELVADTDRPDTDDVALCRCGHSANKPFCDGSHRRVGFSDPGTIQGGRLVGEAQPGADEQVTIVCATNGPLLVRGPLEVIGADGGASAGSRGALCRCGESGNRPFCDGTHKRNGFVG